MAMRCRSGQVMYKGDAKERERGREGERKREREDEYVSRVESRTVWV